MSDVVLKGKKRDDVGTLPEFVTSGVRVGPEQNVQSMVQKGLTSHEYVERNGRLYASDAAYCPRQAVLNSNQTGDVIRPAAFKAYVELGNKVEDLVIEALHNVGALLFKQYRLPDFGINLGGKIDAIVVINGHIRILEIKSCGELPTKPKPYQASQALMYSAVTGLKSSLVYFSRHVADYSGQLKIRQFDLDVTGDEAKGALWFSAYAEFANRRKVLPSIPSHITAKSHCGFCSFTDSCFGVEPFPPVQHVTPAVHAELVAETNAFVDDMMTPSKVQDRRNGILNFIMRNGSRATHEFLADKDWTTII